MGNKVTFQTELKKLNEEQRLVYGWLYVTEKAGQRVVDHSGETIDDIELQKAVHEYVLDSRLAKMNHEGEPVADLVESMVFTKELQDALGIDLGQAGWFAAYKVHDDETWAKIKSGDLKMFSIGGTARRVDIEA